jgi:hypothetical protein
VAIELYRIDDRLIHGQVIVGWGQPMGLGFLVLVDDEVARSEWEQELYRMGVPPELDVFFASVADATTRLDEWNRDRRPGILLTSDIDTIDRREELHSSRQSRGDSPSRGQGGTPALPVSHRGRGARAARARAARGRGDSA